MTNDFNQIPSESEFRGEMTVRSDEYDPMDSQLEAQYEDRTHIEDEPSCGWPGDGSGEDDFADFNAG